MRGKNKVEQTTILVTLYTTILLIAYVLVILLAGTGGFG